MASKQNENERSYFNLGEFEVDHVRELEDSNVTLFTLYTDGLTLYNMRYIPAGKNKDGKRYNAFISCPEEKGKDGKYYKVYNVFFSEEDMKAVITAVKNFK